MNDVKANETTEIATIANASAPWRGRPRKDIGPMPSVNDLRQIVGVIQESSRANNTKRAYKYGFLRFERFCAHYALCACPASVDTVCLFVAYEGRHSMPNSIGSWVSAINHAHDVAGFPSPGRAKMVADAIAGIKRHHGEPAKQMFELRGPQIVAMCEILDTKGGVRAIQEKAHVLTQFAACCRASEIRDLEYRDLRRVEHGFDVTLRRSKTDQEGKGVIKPIVTGKNPASDPVLALTDWLEVYAEKLGGLIPANYPVFPGLRPRGGDDSGDAGILFFKGKVTKRGSHTFNARLKALACAVDPNLPPERIAGHSLRSGHATTAAENGASRESIAAAGDWKSSVVEDYIRKGTAASQSSSAHLGL